MSLSKLYPFAGNHAIQNAVFVLEWPSPLEPERIKAISELAELKADFPTIQQMQTLTVNINAPGIAPEHSSQIGGVHFLLQNPQQHGATVRSIQLSTQNCIVVMSEYSGWENVWAQVRKWFSTLLPLILDGRPLTGIALQYSDVFTWKDTAESLDCRKVFREGSPYLPANAVEQKNLWHSHHGWFESPAKPMPHRLLTNVNINLVDNPDTSRAVTLLTVHKADNFAIWGLDEANANIDEMMPILHNQDKQTLRNLLSDDVLTMIGLA